jgi:hypothetical protein
MLRDEFSKVTQAAVARGYDLLAIDTTRLTLDQVVGQAEDALRSRLNGRQEINA